MRSDSASGVDETLVSTPRVLASGETPAVGKRIGRYVVVHPIGAGAMGTVVAAYDPELARKVAIKLLHARSSKHVDWLRHEAQTLAQLNHPNVVAVYDVGVLDDSNENAAAAMVFIAMEFVDGTTLRRWLTDSERSVAEIVDTFMLAGRGLAAAHAAGIVHRDFKPDNVLVARDARGSARVRVVDFGIAARDEYTTSSRDASPSSLPPASAGTPAYMAPEQHLATGADHRVDQFSFCVALFEAVAGRRPFDVTADSGERTLVESTPRPVPRWVRRVLLRGLSIDPKHRYPSMDALLDALASASPRRRMRRLALVVAAASVGIVGWASARWSAPAVCPDAKEQLADAWDANARSRVEAVFSASPRPFAAMSSGAVTTAIDAWAAEWQTGFESACAAPSTLRERDLRLACLESARARMAAVVDVLETGEPEVVERAIRMVAALRHETDCEDLGTMEREPPPPDDDALAARVASVRARLARVSALGAAYRGAAALALADSLAAEVEQIGYEPLRAELHVERARVQVQSGAFDDAQRDAAEGLRRAVAAGTDRTALRAALALSIVARRRERWDDARQWIALADAYLQRLGGSTSLAASIEDARFGLAVDTGAFDEAELHLNREQQLRASLGQRDVDTLAEAAHRRAQISFGLGDTPGAAAHMQEVLALLGDSLGPDHPNAVSTEGTLAVLEWELHSIATALPMARHAVAARARDVGEHSPHTILMKSNLAMMLMTGGVIEEARELAAEVLATHLRLSGDGVAAAESRVNLALVEIEAEQFARARELVDLAITALQGAKVPDRQMGVAFGVSARVAIGEGRYEAALAELERSRQLNGDTKATATSVEIDAWRALALAGLGRHEDARASAVRVATQVHEIPLPAWRRAKFRLDAARALAHSDPAGARELASLAATDARSEGEYARHTLSAAEALLTTLSR